MLIEAKTISDNSLNAITLIGAFYIAFSYSKTKRGCCSELGMASRVISAEEALMGLENTDLNCAGVSKRNSRVKV